jgi:hypothetical protein
MAKPDDWLDVPGDEDDLWDRILNEGELVAYQDWDSGGPGAGAGRDSIYYFGGNYYGFHDAGSEGPFKTKAEAVAVLDLYSVGDATVEIWDKESGCIWPTE